MPRAANIKQFPMIVTHRLLLQLLTPEDAPAVLRHFADPDVTRFMDIEPLSDEAQAREIIQFHAQDSGCRWGIFLSSNPSKQLIGTCGFHCWDVNKRTAELGFDLAKEFWRQGYMQECLQPLIDFAFERMQLSSIEAEVEPQNRASIHLLQKLGFVKQGSHATGLLLFTLSPTDWAKLERENTC